MVHTFGSLDLYSGTAGFVGSFDNSCPCTVNIDPTCVIAVKVATTPGKGFVMCEIVHRIAIVINVKVT